MKDDIRPRATVQVECEACAIKGERGFFFWVSCDDPLLPFGPFVCDTCRNGSGPQRKDGAKAAPS